MFLLSSNIKLVETFEVMADIQILRDHVKHVGLSYIFRCLSVTFFLLWRAPCHEWTPGFPSETSLLSQLEMGATRLQNRLCGETNWYPGQNHTRRVTGMK